MSLAIGASENEMWTTGIEKQKQCMLLPCPYSLMSLNRNGCPRSNIYMPLIDTYQEQ